MGTPRKTLMENAVKDLIKDGFNVVDNGETFIVTKEYKIKKGKNRKLNVEIPKDEITSWAAESVSWA